MIECANCKAKNPAGSRFCNACGSPLSTSAPAAMPEERKVVSALFCDLVGFTATSEGADPEDVDRMLSAYFAMARSRIETHGGVVEKFIGDAVLGVFGVPAAHEDDPERAVRAGLRIAEGAAEMQTIGGAALRLRVGINTGEVLVRHGVAPGSGERFLAGDAVNTASRIQSVAPEMGVAVGHSTYTATEALFDYAELPPVSLKGLAEPIRIFHARAPRARLGIDLARTVDSPFVGRANDLARLNGLFDKTLAAPSPQLVTVTGEPGIGKSRLVAELRICLDDRRDFTTWRQGRCLPYGEGITFWALGEILKAHAGILESDPPRVAATKLETVLPGGDERPWFRQRLLPLIGLEATSTAEREELFTAWRRFLESIAAQGPTVLVFEDLHSADEALLAFLENLAGRAEGVPLLVVGTARPELFERHPDFAAGLRNATRINLAPLTDEETARLASSLLGTTVLPVELRRPILGRAEGNPLFAVEFVRLLKDRDLLVRSGATWELRAGAEVPFPDTIQALLAARLDTLSAGAKSMLADAAVIGKVFWAGAIVQMGERDLTDVIETLRELVRIQLVRPAPYSSVEGELEYAFWHGLARDVAYNQLPRTSRAARHVAAARWIESTAPERVEDLADVLAYHVTTALDLARATGQTEQARALETPALRFLSLAGERALGLDTTAALSNLERALALAPPGHTERPEALVRFGQAAFQSGRLAEASGALEEAIIAFRAAGRVSLAAHAMNVLGDVLVRVGDPRRWTLPAEALALLEPLGPSPALVAALTEVASADALQLRSEDAVRVAERALALATGLGLPRPARALGFRGMARANLGDRGGLDDFREAIELATTAGLGREVALLHNNLGWNLLAFEGPVAALGILRDGIAYARPRGLAEMLDGLTQSMIDALLDSGEHEKVLEIAAEVAPRMEASGDVLALVGIRAAQARIFALRGQSDHAGEVLAWLEPSSRELGGADDIMLGLGSAALVRAGLGQVAQTVALLTEVESCRGVRHTAYYPFLLPAMVRTALRIGQPAIAERLVAGYEPRSPYAGHALVAANAALTEARGDPRDAAGAYADAADRWRRFGVVPEQAFALLGEGRCLLALREPDAGEERLRESRVIWARLEARPRIDEIKALLATATS